MSGIGQSIPGITSPGTPLAVEDPGGATIVPNASIIQFTGAVGVAAGGPGEVIVNIGGVGSFANTSLTNLIAPVQPNEDIDLQGLQFIINSPNPVNPQDVATKDYVDNGVFVNQQLSNLVAPVQPNEDIDLQNVQFIINSPNPVNPQDVATKDYVDSLSPSTAWLLAGNNLAGGEFLGSLNAFDVVLICGGTESVRLINGAGLDVNQGGYVFTYASNNLLFGNQTVGGVIISTGVGSLAYGSSNAAGSSISATAVGATAFGTVDNGGVILASNDGALAVGSSQQAGSVLSATSVGSICLGFCVTAGIMTSSGQGSMAFGSATGATILSSNAGSFAFGNSSGAGSTITASGPGSFAFGNNEDGNNITASGDGSFAGGDPQLGDVIASAQSSFAFGNDLNVSALIGQAFGLGNVNSSYASMVIGGYGESLGTVGAWVSTEPLFVIGNGVAGVPANAFQIDKDGKQYETGAIIVPARLVTTTDVISDRTDRKLVVNDIAAGVNTLTLPAGVTGLTYDFGVATANTGTWTLLATGADVIDGNVDITLAAPQQVTFITGTWYSV